MKPVLQALLVADHIYTDAVTGKKIVAGIFHRLLFKKPEQREPQNPENPGQATIQVPPGGQSAGSPFCYVSLTDIHGQQQFELRYVDLKSDLSLLGTKFNVESSNPLETVEIVLPLPSLPAAHPGTFAIELLWNNESLGSHRITVDEIKSDDKPSSNPNGK